MKEDKLKTNGDLEYNSAVMKNEEALPPVPVEACPVGLKNLEFPRAVLAQGNSSFVQSGECGSGDIYNPVESRLMFEKPTKKSKGKECRVAPIFAHEITWFKNPQNTQETLGVKLGHFFEAKDADGRDLLCYRGFRCFFLDLTLTDDDLYNQVPFSASFLSSSGGAAGKKLAAHFALNLARKMAPWSNGFKLSSESTTVQGGKDKDKGPVKTFTFHKWIVKKDLPIKDENFKDACANWAPIVAEYSKSYGSGGAQGVPSAQAPATVVAEDDVPF